MALAMTRRRLLSTLVTVALLGGCLGRSLPLPPPSVTSQSVTECAASVCPSGGVTVTLEGTALPNATVVVEDLNPAQMGARGELLAVVTRADDEGAWRAILGPRRDPDSERVLAPQRGDTVQVWQVSVEGDASGVRRVVIPRGAM